eukprot:scaffold220561_cov24-Prasinocladus_malaysianus.AAC.1
MTGSFPSQNNLQADRLDEARAMLQRHQPEPGALAMQRQYMEAWLALRSPEGPSASQLKQAWQACRAHLSPGAAVSQDPRWRRRWGELVGMLALLGGEGAGMGKAGDGSAIASLGP